MLVVLSFLLAMLTGHALFDACLVFATIGLLLVALQRPIIEVALMLLGATPEVETLTRDYFGVRPGGNFEGHNILNRLNRLPRSMDDEERLKALTSAGRNAFMEYQVPEAIIKLKQGFGRLIRTKADTGQVVILDPRVRTKRYGQIFLDSLPECELVVEKA